jgi:hypothetical protein
MASVPKVSYQKFMWTAAEYFKAMGAASTAFDGAPQAR